MRRGAAILSVLYRSSLIISLALAIAFVSCGSMMPGVKVESQEALKSIRKVLLGPITVDESTLAACSWAERAAKTALLHQTGNAPLFSLSESDSLVGSAWRKAPSSMSDLARSAASAGFDGILLCEIEGVSVEFGQEINTGLSISTLTLKRDTLALYKWGGSNITLKVIDVHTGSPVIVSRFAQMLEDRDLQKIAQFAEYAAEMNVSGAVAGAFAQMVEEWDWATMNGRPIAIPDSQ